MDEHTEEHVPVPQAVAESVVVDEPLRAVPAVEDIVQEPPAHNLASEAKVATATQGRSRQLFGREKPPVHIVLGGGKAADVFLWRHRNFSAGVLGVATAIWVLFEVLEYHLLTLIAHVLIALLTVSFVSSKALIFINKKPPKIPEVSISEDLAVRIAQDVRNEINRGLYVLREIATGRDLQKFLSVIVALWFLSSIGSCCNFLTLLYFVVIMLHTVPLLYEKYEDKVDHFLELAASEAKKQYQVLDAKVLKKIPRGLSKDKKQQ